MAIKIRPPIRAKKKYRMYFVFIGLLDHIFREHAIVFEFESRRYVRLEGCFAPYTELRSACPDALLPLTVR
jgi:hypothetical protein